MNKGAYYIAIAVIIFLAIVGTYAYIQRPDRVISDAITKLSQAQTEHFHAAIVLGQTPAGSALLKEATDLTLTLDGSFDRHALPVGRQGDGRDSLASDITINAKSDSVSVELNGELRLIGDKAYLLVKKAPAAIPLLAKLKDTWAELPRGEASNQTNTGETGPLFQDVKRISRGKYTTLATQAGVVHFMDNVASVLGTHLTDQQISGLEANLSQAKTLPVILWISPWSHELQQIELQPGNSARYTISFSERNQGVNHEVPGDAQPIRDILGS